MAVQEMYFPKTLKIVKKRSLISQKKFLKMAFVLSRPLVSSSNWKNTRKLARLSERFQQDRRIVK